MKFIEFGVVTRQTKPCSCCGDALYNTHFLKSVDFAAHFLPECTERLKRRSKSRPISLAVNAEDVKRRT